MNRFDILKTGKYEFLGINEIGDRIFYQLNGVALCGATDRKIVNRKDLYRICSCSPICRMAIHSGNCKGCSNNWKTWKRCHFHVINYGKPFSGPPFFIHPAHFVSCSVCGNRCCNNCEKICIHCGGRTGCGNIACKDECVSCRLKILFFNPMFMVLRRELYRFVRSWLRAVQRSKTSTFVRWLRIY